MIKKVSIRNFIAFDAFEEESFANLNIIIGTNDTGKTGLLKLLYSFTKSLEDFSQKGNITFKGYSDLLSEKLLTTFQPSKKGLAELVRKGQNEKFKIELTYQFENQQYISTSFGDSTQKQINDVTANNHINLENSQFNTVFIPAKEVLTAFNAIAITREQHNMPGFDDTYYDLITALRIPTTQGRITDNFNKVNQQLEDLFEGKIKQNLDNKELPFLFKKGNTEFSMPLTAEGIKKIGILTTLIGNRKITKNTILFLDEPETALHPSAVRVLAKILFLISQTGVQIFISTHNYFLIKQLAILSQTEKVDINCYSLTKSLEKDVVVAKSNLQNGIPDNPIIDESLAIFKEELAIQIKNATN